MGCVCAAMCLLIETTSEWVEEFLSNVEFFGCAIVCGKYFCLVLTRPREGSFTRTIIRMAHIFFSLVVVSSVN